MRDLFECLDCLAVDHLNTHGRCARCNSNAVMSYDIINRQCVDEQAHTIGGLNATASN